VDDFTSTTLDSRWSWINEDPSQWSLTKQRGNMKITCTSSGLFCNSTMNLLVQPAPEGDFAIQTYLLFKPKVNFQFAGLLVYLDDGNYVAFGRAFCDVEAPTCVGNGIYFDHEEADTWIQPNFATAVTQVAKAYLRLERRGNEYIAYYSADAKQWQYIGTHTGGFTPAYIGLYVGNGCSEAPKIPAAFNYFKLIIP
jgi:beta-xylosidase